MCVNGSSFTGKSRGRRRGDETTERKWTRRPPSTLLGCTGGDIAVLLLVVLLPVEGKSGRIQLEADSKERGRFELPSKEEDVRFRSVDLAVRGGGVEGVTN